MSSPRIRVLSLLTLALLSTTVDGRAQRGPGSEARSIDIDPPQLTLAVGESATLSAVVRGADGEVLASEVVFLTRDARSLAVGQDGRVEALAPGRFIVVARVPGGQRGGAFLSSEVEVVVAFPPLERLEIRNLPDVLYTGAPVRPDYVLFDTSGEVRADDIVFRSDDPTVASVDPFGLIRPRSGGSTLLWITSGELVDEVPLTVRPNPAASLELTGQARARTGEVVRFAAVVRDPEGRPVEGLPVYFSVEPHARAIDASALMESDGRFVAETPGLYTVRASAGAVFETATIEVEPRNVAREVSVVGRAPVSAVHSSDLWVWEGVDGRDYAITGTWGGNGEAYIWDVTEPDRIERVGVVRVDARTVNDVKVSGDGRVAVITREGASNRRNGVVVLDVSNPASVQQIAAFDEGMTGGVHNAFIDGTHLYAVNNGTRYDVINIGEPAAPFRVALFEPETPGHSVHDVWVEDGIAYSSNWEDGVVLVDVGNGIAGGAPDRPVQFAAWSDARGDTHAAFPFRSQSTGRFYVVVGEESFPNGLNPDGPTVPAGYMHIVDFTDLDHPVAVARFEVPEAGSHNIWIEDDVLYAAFYNGGLRIVDLSGELMGDLYRQGREIARFLPKHEEAIVPNESMVWGAQPHKGTIFLSDWNSGLWAIQLAPSRVPD